MREMKEGKNLTSDAKDFVQLDGGEDFGRRFFGIVGIKL